MIGLLVDYLIALFFNYRITSMPTTFKFRNISFFFLSKKKMSSGFQLKVLGKQRWQQQHRKKIENHKFPIEKAIKFKFSITSLSLSSTYWTHRLKYGNRSPVWMIHSPLFAAILKSMLDDDNDDDKDDKIKEELSCAQRARTKVNIQNFNNA